MYQVDATATTPDELRDRLDEIWNGQPSLADHPRDTFEKSADAVADLIATGGLAYPLNVTLTFQERVVHPDAGWGVETTPGSVSATVREVV